MLASIAARPRSPMTRIRRRGNRSTQTPAGKVKSRKGRNSIVASRPTSPGGAFRITAAMNGMASWLTPVPNSEIVAAVQSFAKFGLRKRLRRAVEATWHLGWWAGWRARQRYGMLANRLTPVSPLGHRRSDPLAGATRRASRGPRRRGTMAVMRAIPDDLSDRLIESVPNVSEGRRLDVVDRLAGAVSLVPGVHLLDR